MDTHLGRATMKREEQSGACEVTRATSLTLPTSTSSRTPSDSVQATGELDVAVDTKGEAKYRNGRPPRTLDRLPRGFIWADNPSSAVECTPSSEAIATASSVVRVASATAEPGEDMLAKAMAASRWGYVRVPENTRYVVERGGVFHRVLEPGLRMMVPRLDRVAYVFSKKMQRLAFRTAHVPTTDRVPVTVRGVLFYVVDEPIAAAYAVDNVCDALIDLAAAAVHSEFAKRSVDALFRDLSHVWARVAQQVNDASCVWGVRALSFSSQVVLPPAITRAYERLTHARVQQRVADARTQADALRRERRCDARAREIQVAAEGRVLVFSGDARAESDALLMKGDANAGALSAIAEALNRPSGREAARVWIASRYLDTLAGRSNQLMDNVSSPAQMVDQALNLIDSPHVRARSTGSGSPRSNQSLGYASRSEAAANILGNGVQHTSPPVAAHARHNTARPHTPAVRIHKIPRVPDNLVIAQQLAPSEHSAPSESPVTPQTPPTTIAPPSTGDQSSRFRRAKSERAIPQQSARRSRPSTRSSSRNSTTPADILPHSYEPALPDLVPDSYEPAPASSAEAFASGADAFASGADAFSVGIDPVWTSNISEHDDTTQNLELNEVRAEIACPVALGAWPRSTRRAPTRAPPVARPPSTKLSYKPKPNIGAISISPKASNMTAADDHDTSTANDKRHSKRSLAFRPKNGRSRHSLDGTKV